MKRPSRRNDLTAAELKLLFLMQKINFGRIRNLVVHVGQPVFAPPPLMQRDHKFGGQNGVRPESNLRDFVLKKEHVDLFEAIRAMGDTTIVNLEVRCGLPLLMTDEEDAA